MGSGAGRQVTASRTVVLGSALPLLLLVGLVGLPAVRSELGSRSPVSASGEAEPGVFPSWVTTSLTTDRAPAAQVRAEAKALTRLRRSLSGSAALGFTATERVTSWRAGGPLSRVLDLVQRPGGPRSASVQPTAAAGRSAPVPGADPLATLSERAVAALAAGYDLRIGGTDRIAGRPATVIVARRDGRDLARLWLDDGTGLLVRQDVVDRTGRLRRTATVLSLHVDRTTTTTTAPRTPAGVRLSSMVATRNGSQPQPQTQTRNELWAAVTPAEAARWQADGWPCPQQLAQGYSLLDVRRGSAAGGAPVLQLVYGDGLSSISVFVQRGRLDDRPAPGLVAQKWGSGTAVVRAGWPEVVMWQGGKLVITAVGDDDPATLETVLAPLPRRPDRGALGSLQHGMGSALAWFKS